MPFVAPSPSPAPPLLPLPNNQLPSNTQIHQVDNQARTCGITKKISTEMVETLIALRSNWSSQRASTNSSGKRNLRLGLVQVMLRGLNTTQDLIRAGSVNFFTFFVEKASQCPLLIRKNNTLCHWRCTEPVITRST